MLFRFPRLAARFLNPLESLPRASEDLLLLLALLLARLEDRPWKLAGLPRRAEDLLEELALLRSCSEDLTRALAGLPRWAEDLLYSLEGGKRIYDLRLMILD